MKGCAKKVLFGGVLILYCSVSLYSQVPDTLWTKKYGGPDVDIGYSVQTTSDGNFILTGYTSSFGAGQEDVYLIKTDSLGDTLWTKIYGGNLTDVGKSVKETSDGGFIIAGWTKSFGPNNTDVYLIKTDINGDTLWTKIYGVGIFNQGNSISLTSDNGYIIAGQTKSGPGGWDVYLMKTDASGDSLWAKIYGTSENDFGYSVQETSDKGFIIAGATYLSGNADVYLIKTDSLGDTLWTRTYGGDSTDIGYSVRQTSDEGFVIAGFTTSVDTTFQDIYLIKTDSSGDTLWTKEIGRWPDIYSIEIGYSVQEMQDGGYVVAGMSLPGLCLPAVYVVRTDALGDALWTKALQCIEEEAFSIDQTQDGGFIIAGYSNFYVYLIRLGPELGIREKFTNRYSDNDIQLFLTPFREKTLIKYLLPEPLNVRIVLYNVLGQEVKMLLDKKQEPGIWTLTWYGENNFGMKVSNGLYFLKFIAGDFRITKKLIVVR